MVWRRRDQMPIDFGPRPPAGRILPFVRRSSGVESSDADGWCARGADVEASDPGQALDAYRKALDLEPEHAEANVNLGRMLHEAGHVRAAEMNYRRALRTEPEHPTALFNLAVALDDLGSLREAINTYERALATDPGNADAHFNLSRLHERAGRKAEAIRHLKAYRDLQRKRLG